MYPAAGLALMVTVKVPQEPKLLDLWKAAWDCLIWKALISKAKATERELNRNLLHLCGGDLSCINTAYPLLTISAISLRSLMT